MSMGSYGRHCSYEPPHPIPMSNSHSPIDPEYYPKTEKRFLSCPDIARHKIIFLGDSASGKSSILSRFTHDTFDEKYQTTIGMDFQSKVLYTEHKTVALQLWDTAGQERYNSLIPTYLRDCSLAIIVFDVTNRISFVNISKWFEMIRAESGHSTPVILVGNKQDLEDGRRISFEEGANRAAELKGPYVETSAKSGYNVEHLFNEVVCSCLTNQHSSEQTSVKITHIESTSEARQQRFGACKC